jgi:hypothetical protein
VTYWSPGFSRWAACRGCGIPPGTPDPAEAGTPERRYLDEHFNFISRWAACRGRGIPPGTPDPAEAGTPERRYLDEHFNFISRWNACRAAASCQGRLIRLKPGLLNGNIWMNISTSSAGTPIQRMSGFFI